MRTRNRQDGALPRTPEDLERKYRFEKQFEELREKASKEYVDNAAKEIKKYTDDGLDKKAQAGFGYGEPMVWIGFDKESWSSTGNFQADLEAAFAAMPQGTCKQVQFIDTNLSNQKFAGTLWKYTGAYGFLTADNYSGAKAIKTYYNSVWNDWEWENPPMVPGVEYKTTERYNNKAVYIKHVNMSTLPASGSKSFPYCSTGSTWRQFNAFLVTSSGNVSPMPYFNTSGTLGATVYASKTNIVVNAQYDISAHSGFAIVRYTKD